MHSGFSCGNGQPNIFFEVPDVSAACCCLHQQAAETSGNSKKTFSWSFISRLPKCLVFQRKLWFCTFVNKQEGTLGTKYILIVFV